MCGASHIQLAVAGARSFLLPVPFDAHQTRSQGKWRLRRKRSGGRPAIDWIGCRPQADDHDDHQGIEKNSPEPLGPGELPFVISNQ
jgi:hypothetical protein